MKFSQIVYNINKIMLNVKKIYDVIFLWWRLKIFLKFCQLWRVISPLDFIFK